MDDLLKRVFSLKRRTKTAIQIAIDSLLLISAFVAAVFFRLESFKLLSEIQVWWALCASVPVTLSAFHFLRLYRVLIRYLTGKILITLGKGVLVGSVILYLSGLFFDANLPRSVPIIYAVFVFLLLGGVRFAARTIFRNPDQHGKRPVIIYGAGDAGLQLLNSLYHGREYVAVALVDEDTNLQRMAVGGLSVYSPEQIAHLVEGTGAQVILLAMPSIGRDRRRQIILSLENLPVEIKTIPSVSEIISGRARISELRTVSAEDLLGRDPVTPEPDLLERNIRGRAVMVSGAGGSIGSELCRQILNQKPATLVLYEVSEFSLYAIEAELSKIAESLDVQSKIVPVLGSVQHQIRLEKTIRAFNIHTIYHAAAYKHVPLVEENIVEGIRNNVFGTRAIVSVAQSAGVRNFILISTDKAVRPTNIMGATKRIAELICQAHANEDGNTLFSMVRFGNVLGSSGSVIPRFKEQIEAGGPVTVTHKDINRYFMTIPEASQLVIQAGAMGKGGDVFVLDMGEPVKIMELAQSMVKLYGLTPYVIDRPEQMDPKQGDIAICVTGLRKGEKLYEELLIGNNPSPTQHPRIMTASEVSLPMGRLSEELERLQMACDTYDLDQVLNILSKLPLEYTPMGSEIYDNVWSAMRANHASHSKLSTNKDLA